MIDIDIVLIDNHHIRYEKREYEFRLFNTAQIYKNLLKINLISR